jgi:hypothetical protein
MVRAAAAKGRALNEGFRTSAQCSYVERMMHAIYHVFGST